MCEKRGENVMKCVLDCIVSKSILERGKSVLTQQEQRDFCLGLPGWCLCSDYSPGGMDQARCKKALSLKRKREVSLIAVEDSGEPSEKTKKHNDECFDFSVTSEDLSKFMEGEIPANTEKSTSYVGCKEL